MFSVIKDGEEYTISSEEDFILACILLDEHKYKQDSQNESSTELVNLNHCRLGELICESYCREIN